MRSSWKGLRRALALLLPFVLLGGPLVTTIWSGKFCPHHHTSPHQRGPCFCDQMASAASANLVSPVALTAPLLVAVMTGPEIAHVREPATSRHDSPAFAPRRPPPKTTHA